MTTVAEVQPKLVIFKAWLTDRGAEVMQPTNEYELLRFRTAKGVSVFYFKKTGVITFYGEAETAWKAYKKNTNWRAMPATKRRAKSTTDMITIRKRDGSDCFYCLEHVAPEDESEEHLVSLTHGGPQHISNKFLAHKDCNNSVGNVSAIEKIKIHVAAVMRKAADNMKEAYARHQ